MQRVRRDEGDHQRVESPDEHRTAVREVVGGRPLGRRADQAVARLNAEVLTPDRMLELDQPTELSARDDGVVDCDVTLTVELELERRQLDDPVLAGEDARQAGLHLVALDRRQEPHAAEVHAEYGHAALEKAR